MVKHLIWILLATAIIIITVVLGSYSSDPLRTRGGQGAVLVRDYKQVARSIDAESLRRTISDLAKLKSRVTGYPGCNEAAKYIKEKFSALGFEETSEDEFWSGEKRARFTSERFSVPIPIDKTAALKVGDKAFRLFPLWPNLVRTSSVPPAGVSGELIYARDGNFADFNEKQVEGSIVLLDFNCGLKWLNASILGAKAIVFIEPESTLRGEAEEKFLTLPINIPRFWLTRSDANRVLDILKSQGNVRGKIDCRMEWEPRSAENIIAMLPGQGDEAEPEISDELIVIQTYYDSMSVVPSLSPGAEQACGVAAMLELMKLFKQYTPKRPLLFVATAGHCEGLSGIKSFVLKHLRDAEKTKQITDPHLSQSYPINIALFIALDLSSRSDRLGVFFKGYMYDEADRILQPWVSVLGRRIVDRGIEIAEALGYGEDDLLIDGINATKGRNWRTYIPGRIAFDSEPVMLAGKPGLAFATIDDARLLVDTPLDTSDKVVIENLRKQVRTLACLLPDYLNTSAPFVTKRLADNWCDLSGRAVEFDVTQDILPDKAVPGALVVARGYANSKALMGVRGDPIAMTGGAAGNLPVDVATSSLLLADKPKQTDSEENRGGDFVIHGMPSVRATGWYRGQLHVEAFKLDKETGDVTYAPDLGEQGAGSFSIDVLMDEANKQITVVLFECASTTIFDLVDQRYYNLLTEMTIYDAGTNSQPFVYGYSLPRPPEWVPYVEPCAVVYAQPGTSLRIGMSMGLAGKQLLLLNANEGDPEGKGFQVDERPSIVRTPYQAAGDMWQLDESRIKRFEKHGITNKQVNGLHAATKRALDRAEAALAESKYDKFVAAARSAWSTESRAYPDILDTVNDAVKGVMFYLALLVPFAYFAERLIFAAATIEKRIMGTFAMFLAIFFALRYVHPAFKITLTPLVVLLAFIIMSLSAVVIVIITMKFEERLEDLKSQRSGIHEDDVGRISFVMAAFTLGISNMRKRAFRTGLTCATLVLLTFSVLSFTSIVTYLRYNKIPFHKAKPTYNGVLFRSRIWQPLSQEAYKALANEFDPVATGSLPVASKAVAPRAWYFSSLVGDHSFVGIENPRNGKSFTAVAALGLAAAEKELFPAVAQHTQKDGCLVSGRWFKNTDGSDLGAIIPKNVAEALEIELDLSKSPEVTVFGERMPVIGIFDPLKFNEVVDIDNESLAPVDYVAMSGRRAEQGTVDTDELEEYLHLSSENIFILPYSFVMKIGGTLRSVAIDFVGPEDVREVLKDLLPRTDLTLFAASGDEVYLYSTIGAVSAGGVTSLFVPVLIAALIVLNTMLGSVYERTKEIGIFNAVGLAPSHVSSLFIAEAVVYAVLGAVFGYLFGQAASKVIYHFGLLPGFDLNFSSLAAVGTSVFIMVVVLLSAVYPAKVASRIAMPASEMGWRLPPTPGDDLEIKLPFTVTGDHAIGVNAYLKEFLDSHVECSVGQFSSEDIAFSIEPIDGERKMHLHFTAWLVPYDLGVSQGVRLETTPTEDEHIYNLHIVLTRLSGDASSWRRLNRNFLNVMRKQFLIWRTLGRARQGMYVEAGAASEVESEKVRK